MKHALTILLFIAFCFPAHAELAEIGVNPLNLEVGSRPLSMGGAFAGLADDVNSALYNPGGLAWVKGISLTGRGIDNFTALQAYPTGYNSALGLAVINGTVSSIPIPAGVANSSSNVVLLSYGTKLNFLPGFFKNEAFQRLGFGLTMKGLFGETLRRTGQTDRSAFGWDMDLGVLYKAAEWWSAGLSLQNFLPYNALGGGAIKWDVGNPEGIPATFKLGGSARIIGDLGMPVFMEGRELTVGGELDLPSSGSALFKIGGEWGLNKTFFLRTGISQQPKAGGVASGLNFGLGYRSESWGVDAVSCRDALTDQGLLYFSVLYFPKDWIVLKKLDVEKPSVVLEEPFEKISLEDNIVTYDDKIEVFGKVKSAVDVFVNDLPAATADDNTFRVTVPLQLEKNLVVVEARYEGEKKQWKYKVLRRAKVQLTEEKDVQEQLDKAKSDAEKEALKKKEQDLAARRKKVEELVTMGVIEVTPEAEFRLDASITRGELAAWLAKASELPPPKVEKDLFPDVKQNDPLAGYIKLVVDMDLLRPFPDGTFRPGSPVTKEEAEKLFNILKKAQR